MKRITFKLLFAVLLGTLTLSSCLKDNDYEPVPHAVLTMVNAFTGTNSVGYFAENTNINTYGNIKYQHPDFRNLFVGNRRIRIIDEQQKVLVDSNFTFKDSLYYSSFIFGEQAKFDHILVEDASVTDLGSNTAYRFLHLSNSDAKVSVYIGSETEPVFSDRETEDATSQLTSKTFISKPAGTHKIVVKDEDGATIVEREFQFESKAYYSLVLIGEKDNANKPLYLGILKQY